jgi:translation initiation factor 2 alpha subunit (eIF-2alpha)
MVQVTKQTVQQWIMIDYLAKKHHYEEMIGQLEVKYGMNYAEFEKRIETASQEVFEEWDDSIDWGAYVGFLEEINQNITEIQQGNFQLVN